MVLWNNNNSKYKREIHHVENQQEKLQISYCYSFARTSSIIEISYFLFGIFFSWFNVRPYMWNSYRNININQREERNEKKPKRKAHADTQAHTQEL